ncbi:hypothetical protein NL676_027839 [Syzygium grande]|nr:hypothetical protein NL676_027839 [Syzygium grande]
MKGLQVLDLSHNNFIGMIPQCLGNVSDGLLVLDLQENRLSGTISLTFTENAALTSLHLNRNQFEGPLPHSLSNCKQLEVLDLGGNKLNDTFPKWLDILPRLRALVLRSNRLHGSIGNPGTEFPFPQLRILDLSSNELTGPLPSAYFGNLKAMMSTDQDGQELRYMDQGYYQDSMIATMKGRDMPTVRILAILTTIDLSSNKFQGIIPDAIGRLRLLKGLNLSHNNLQGHIPLPLGNLSELECGTIPTELTNLTSLEVLNVSSNQLTGSIPQGHQFNTFPAESYHGNPGLCGFPLSKACTNTRAPRKLPVLPEGGVHSFCVDFLEPRAAEIGLGCGIFLGLIMSILKNLISIRRTNRNFRKIAMKDVSPIGP